MALRVARAFVGRRITRLCSLNRASHLTTDSHELNHGFLSTIRQEISRELSKSAALQECRSESVYGPFRIEDHSGAEEVLFCRTYKNENIKVACAYQRQELPDDLKEDAPGRNHLELVSMAVKILKGDSYIEVDCATDGNAPPVISRIAVMDALSGSKQFPYIGPHFEDLDPDMQKCLLLYLQARGIDTKFGAFALRYMVQKDWQEYSTWLQNVEKFMAA